MYLPLKYYQNKQFILKYETGSVLGMMQNFFLKIVVHYAEVLFTKMYSKK